MTAASLIDGRATAGRAADDPAHEIRVAAVAGGLFFVGLFGWAAMASLDAAAYAPGQVKVSGDAQPVQSLEGGVVSAVHVREGQRVAQGEVLMEFTTAQAVAQERSLAQRVIVLLADVARLRAKQEGASAVPEPAEYGMLEPRDRPAAARAMAAAAHEFADWRQTFSSEQKLVGEKVAQVSNQLAGMQARQDANDEQLRLNEQELSAQQKLLAKGFTTQPKVLALQRSAADLRGQHGAQMSEMGRLRNEAGEARMQLLQNRAQAEEQVASELRQSQTDLQSLLPQWRSAQEAVARTQLRAPVAGAVTGLVFKGPGGVATPGQKLGTVVPLDRSLTVEAQVQPQEVNDLAIGQKARVRVTGLHGRNVPMLTGRISRVSADSFTEERTGRAYYTAEVTVPGSELARAAAAAGIPGPIRPGTPVQVEVKLRARTALQYLLEPLGQSLAGSLHER